MHRARRRLLALVLVAAGAAACGMAALTLAPISLPAGQRVVVEIPPGAGASEAARRLAAAGVIRWAPGFRALALITGRARRLQAGEYRFSGTQVPTEVLRRLVSGEVILHEVTIPEGLTLGETVTLLGRSDLEIRGDLEAAARAAGLVQDLDAEADDLEGYLFPDTYAFPRGVAAETVVKRMVERFRKIAAELQARHGRPRRGMRAWVTLASLVEKETGEEDERGRVAGVFENRLRIGMPLQCDPTVIYALDRAGAPRTGPLARQLDFDHPYNTYRYPGLPPGPIANPGREALAAALSPTDTDELYFVADGSGGHRFSRTLEEHNRAVRAWRRLNSGKGR